MSVRNDRSDAVLRILFVCTGNTCRSPMAEAVFRRLAAERLQCQEWELRERGVDVISAGLAAADNDPASREAIDVMREYQVDMSQHLSQPVTDRMLEESTRILAMTQRHLQLLTEHRPDLAHKFALLDRSGTDVPDPIGGMIEDYRQCAETLARNLREWMVELILKES